jgi:antitoxin YefM
MKETGMAKTLPISEVKTRLPELVSGVAEREEEIVVTRNGKPAAVLVNYAEYECLRASLEVLSDRKLMTQIRRSRTFYSKGGKGASFDQVFGEALHAPKKRRR